MLIQVKGPLGFSGKVNVRRSLSERAACRANWTDMPPPLISRLEPDELAFRIVSIEIKRRQ